MFCSSGTNRRAPESPTWGNSLYLCCAPRKGGAAASRQSMVTPRARAPGHPSGIVEGTNLWLGSSDNQFSWPPAQPVDPGGWGCGFLAAFSYLPNPRGCDGLYSRWLSSISNTFFSETAPLAVGRGRCTSDSVCKGGCTYDLIPPCHLLSLCLNNLCAPFRLCLPSSQASCCFYSWT